MKNNGPERDVDEPDEDGHFDRRPTTPASACPEVAPKTPTATAIASSKSWSNGERHARGRG